jgi:ribosomal protein S18 acetylase RimI-like enzyme
MSAAVDDGSGVRHRFATRSARNAIITAMTMPHMTDIHDEVAVAELREQVIAFNIAVTGYEDGRSLGCFVRNGDGKLVAGLDGFTWGGYAMIEWLWVAEPGRRQGLGRQLMVAAEEEAVARGCAVVRVNTHTFQAPGFYRKLGYEEVGFASNAPAHHGEVFFSKRV